MWFFLAGGFPMIFVLVFGLMAVAGAGRFAWAPSMGRLPHLVALGVALLLAGAAGFTVDMLAVSVKVPQDPQWSGSPDLPLVLLVGFGESLTPLILALGFTTLEATLLALGLKRLST